MKSEKRLFLLAGGNIEPRSYYLEQTEKQIRKQIGEIVQYSSVYESEPWGFKADTAFLNQVFIIDTKLSSTEVLKKIHAIEELMGRKRNGTEYISRTIDIDILYLENEITETEELTVPHPRLHLRKFALLPLSEIAADFIHPVLKKTNDELLGQLKDNSKVWKVEGKKSESNV